jgi:arylsulfatase
MNNILKKWAALMSLAAPPVFCGADEAKPKPNILVILADDMGYSDIGCYGGEIETPNLDALARNGLRFTQFYNAARCCPSRASLLTGLYPHQAGVGHMDFDFGYGIPAYQGHLNNRCVTLAEVLRPAGYRTSMAGKWHVGGAPGRRPLDRGFDRFWGVPTGGGVYFKETVTAIRGLRFLNDEQLIEPSALPDDMYVTDTFTDKALGYIDEAVSKKKPFFLYLAHIAPHWPLQAKPADIRKYKGRYDIGWDAVRAARHQRQIKLGIVPANSRISERDPKATAWAETPAEVQKNLAHRMEIYAAMVDSLDQNVGRIVARLKELDQFDNTLILFLSDNGCSAEGGPGLEGKLDNWAKPGAPLGTALSYGRLGLEWANACNTPFRKFKIETYEGGVATPLIVHWPDGIAARGELRHQTGHVIDLMPTLAEVAGAVYPDQFGGQPILPTEGRSLVPAFRNTPLPREEGLFFEHGGNKAVRIGDWKAVQPQGKNGWELYEMQSDRTELVNLAAEHPERVRELAARWQTWAERCGVWDWAELNRHIQTEKKVREEQQRQRQKEKKTK